MNINSIDLLNSRSFLKQKINLTGDVKNSPIYEKELFLIPKFTVVGFPIQTLQKSSYYYIELQIVETYSYDFDINKEPSEGLLDDERFNMIWIIVILSKQVENLWYLNQLSEYFLLLHI